MHDKRESTLFQNVLQLSSHVKQATHTRTQVQTHQILDVRGGKKKTEVICMHDAAAFYS